MLVHHAGRARRVAGAAQPGAQAQPRRQRGRRDGGHRPGGGRRRRQPGHRPHRQLQLELDIEIALQVARHMNVYFRRTGNDTALSPWLIARSHMHPAVHRVQDAIASAPDAAHDLMTLAKIACVSSRHLTRIFKQHTGMTVHDYQITLRHALFEQWRAQGLSQEKAAIAAGFSSANAWRRSRVRA